MFGGHLRLVPMPTPFQQQQADVLLSLPEFSPKFCSDVTGLADVVRNGDLMGQRESLLVCQPSSEGLTSPHTHGVVEHPTW